MADTEKLEFITKFEEIFRNEKFHLPIRWDGKDFYATLYSHLKAYREAVNNQFGEDSDIAKDVKTICRSIYWAVDDFFRGLPNESFKRISKILSHYSEIFLQRVLISNSNLNDLPLFRVVDAGDTATHDREFVFHAPFSMRTKITTNRYSIAGFPSLYLGTSLKLCCEETHKDPFISPLLASRFKLDTKWKPNNESGFDDNNFTTIDLATKPHDFFVETSTDNNNLNCRPITKKDIELLNKEDFRRNYLLRYPLIASCSFIRAKRNDSFSPEYIVPQIVTQFARSNAKDSIVGIRYFSCSSARASEMGINYVFPSLGTPYRVRKTVTDYCARLAHRFKLTKPIFIHEFSSIEECAKALISIDDKELDYIVNFEETDNKKIENPFTIPDGTSEIGVCAFSLCKELTKINIPDSVTNIGYFAFLGCIGLNEIILPDSVTSIEIGAFLYCIGLESIFIPNRVISIDKGTFSGCKNLTIYCRAK